MFTGRSGMGRLWCGGVVLTAKVLQLKQPDKAAYVYNNECLNERNVNSTKRTRTEEVACQRASGREKRLRIGL